MMHRGEDWPDAGHGEEIKPYKIRVSSKYLDLTRQKLELTRLPRSSPEPRSRKWWDPKPTVEPLIDYWLEHYSWRQHEDELNSSATQFRTSFAVPGAETPVRLHFIHTRSPYTNAIPLLLIPPFPFTNLSLLHMVNLLADPHDVDAEQPFHVVVPSLPGLGFSDALPANAGMIPAIASMLDTLMSRLGYPYYLATNSGAAANTLCEVDWQVADYLSKQYSTSCLGVHFVSPPIQPPEILSAPVEWLKWKFARLLKTPSFGYTLEDVSAVQNGYGTATIRRYGGTNMAPTDLGLGAALPCEPNTMAFSLCDSPAGLLLFILMAIRRMGPQKDLSPKELITMTELMWLPGPEATMRLWAQCVTTTTSNRESSHVKPKVGITVFTGNFDETKPQNHRDEESSTRHWSRNRYICPSWGRSHYNVVSSDRLSGTPGLTAWERPEVIVTGVQKLAQVLVQHDSRLQPQREPHTTLLEQVITEGGEIAQAEVSGTTVQNVDDAELSTTDHQKAAGAKSASGAHLHPKTPPPQASSQAVRNGRGVDQGESGGSPATVISIRAGN